MPKRLSLIAGAVMAVSLALPAQSEQHVDASTVVATVNGTDITVANLIVMRQRLPEQYQQIAAPQLYTAILDQLVNQTLLAQGYEGERPDWVVATIQNEERGLVASLALESMVDGLVTDEDVQAFFDETYGNAEGEQEFNASHILVETENEAIDIRAALDGGANFAQLAAERSTGPSGPNGGSLGWFTKGRMVPRFEEAVLALEVGQISAPVETQFGWHVVILNDTRIQSGPALEDVRADIEEALRSQKLEAALDAKRAAASISTIDSSEIDPQVIFDNSIFE